MRAILRDRAAIERIPTIAPVGPYREPSGDYAVIATNLRASFQPERADATVSVGGRTERVSMVVYFEPSIDVRVDDRIKDLTSGAEFRVVGVKDYSGRIRGAQLRAV